MRNPQSAIRNPQSPAPDALAAARRAQERVWALQRAGADPNGPEGRRAVNQLISRLRGLAPEDLAAFEAWRAAGPPPADQE